MICFEQEGLHFFRMRKKLPTAAEAVERGMKVWQPAAQEWPDPFNDGEVFMLTAWQHKWYENDEGEERDRALLDNQYKCTYTVVDTGLLPSTSTSTASTLMIVHVR